IVTEGSASDRAALMRVRLSNPMPIIFFLSPPPPPRSILFPYTTLFRSGFCEEKLWVYLATELTETTQQLEDDEILDVVRIPSSRSEEHTSELQSLRHLVCRLLLEKKNAHILLAKIAPHRSLRIVVYYHA